MYGKMHLFTVLVSVLSFLSSVAVAIGRGEPEFQMIVPGDINGDLKVDFTDLAILADHWLQHSLNSDTLTSACPQNPPLNSVLSAHGDIDDTDPHIDAAEAFISGKTMTSSNEIVANHCPDTWTKKHIHVGLQNTAHFYYDKDRTPLGKAADDTDQINGVDQAMLFFYAGHSNLSTYEWHALGELAHVQNVSLGDCPGGGLLRYCWMCSCQVFAHGPVKYDNGKPSYPYPGKFDGSSDSVNMRNVYERWGPALTSNLRMACGTSTNAICTYQTANSIWYNYKTYKDYNAQKKTWNTGKSFSVADAVIAGLCQEPWIVPLCITVGGWDVKTTPLYDLEFTNQPNTSGSICYHIQYLEEFADWPVPALDVPPLPVPQKLPILNTDVMPPPWHLREIQFKSRDNLMLSVDEVRGRGPKVRVNLTSGAVHVVGEHKLGDMPILKEAEYVEHARRFIEEQGWSEENMAEPTGMKFMIRTRSIEGDASIPERQKNVVVTFRRRIEVEGINVNVLGEGGEITVQLNNDGSILNGSKVWRKITDQAHRPAAVKTYEEAYEEALEQLEDPQMYVLYGWTWGYKELDANVEQNEMHIVFWFNFVPADLDCAIQCPPRRIEIFGHPEPLSPHS